MVVRGRTGSAVARRPEVGACLQRAGRQVAAAASRPLCEFRNIGGNLHHEAAETRSRSVNSTLDPLIESRDSYEGISG